MTITVERVRNRIHLRSSYDPRTVELCKAVGGGSFSRQGGPHWRYPLTLQTCYRLREIFGKSLKIGVELAEWARAEIDREKKLDDVMSMDYSVPAELPACKSLAPTLYRAVTEGKPFQSVAVKYGAVAGPNLIGDQPGIGKTIESLGQLIESGISGNILVVCPKTSVRAVWIPEINRWLGDYAGRAYAVSLAHVENSRGRYVSATRAEREEAITAFLEPSPEDEGADAGLRFAVVNAEMLRTQRISECRTGACDGDDVDCTDKRKHKLLWRHEYPTLFYREWDAVIGDEVHMYLGNASIRSKHSSQVGMGFNKLPVKANGTFTTGHPRPPMKIAASGTPARGKPAKLWGVLNWLRPDLYPGKWKFVEKYCDSKANPFNKHSGLEYLDSIRPEMEDEFGRELSRIMIRRTKSELRAINPKWAPPPKQYINRWVDLDPKQQKMYDAMEADATARLEGGTLLAIGILEEMTRLRQFAQSGGKLVPVKRREWRIVRGKKKLFEWDDFAFVPQFPSSKFDYILHSYLPELGITSDRKALAEHDNKVIIASQFTTVVNLYAAGLRKAGIDCYVLTGETKDDLREEYRDNFQKPGGPRVFLLQTKTGGVSITLDAADNVLINDETWVPDDQEQVEDRAHRSSNVDHFVTVTYLRANNTIERDIAEMSGIRDLNNHFMLDAQRGVEYAKGRYGVKVGRED